MIRIRADLKYADSTNMSQIDSITALFAVPAAPGPGLGGGPARISRPVHFESIRLSSDLIRSKFTRGGASTTYEVSAPTRR